MARRPQRGPAVQKSVTLPVHFWDLLDKATELQDESYKLMGGKRKYTLSDLFEGAVEMYIRSMLEDLGPFPTTAAERKDYVERLAKMNQRDLADEFLSKSKSH